jgi:hypothetical protein
MQNQNSAENFPKIDYANTFHIFKAKKSLKLNPAPTVWDQKFQIATVKKSKKLIFRLTFTI